MKLLLNILLSLCFLASFTACGDQTVTFDDQWKLDNEKQFEKIASDPAYKDNKIKALSGKDAYIVYKSLEKADDDSPRPAFTDYVKVYYTGWYKFDWSQGDTYPGDDGDTFTNKREFVYSRDNIPSTLAVSSGIVEGLSLALQHMKVGDKWEIWVPWSLGYGSSGYASLNIKGDTTLVYEVELVEIVE
ncbi:MAG TPA: hypothetical protein DDZ78_17290 [Porphyromonadaceae bacterium]|nr:hypothetical protein [Porphyromonadaceae bacterium]